MSEQPKIQVAVSRSEIEQYGWKLAKHHLNTMPMLMQSEGEVILDMAYLTPESCGVVLSKEDKAQIRATYELAFSLKRSGHNVI